MFSSKSFSRLLPTLLAGVQLVSAGPGSYYDLINATPYDWQLIYSHQYHMDWNPAPVIPAGTSMERYFEYYYHWGDNGDGGAEATYSLVGYPTKASFTIQARQSKGKRIEIQYHDALYSLNNPENTLLNLGWIHDGAVAFVLSGNGNDTPFISTNPPVAWMQATLPTIASHSMREIAMVASHDSGMSEMTRRYGGVAHNTLTQTVNIYQQLMNGARYFDIRPVVRRGTWSTCHVSDPGDGKYVGGFGRTIKNIVQDINRFTAEQPGELLILDISHELQRESWKALSAEKWQDLYKLLGKITNLWAAPANIGNDLSTVPISTFIQLGSKSAVLIRIPDYAPLPEGVATRDTQEATGSGSDADYDNSLPSENAPKTNSLQPTVSFKRATSMPPTHGFFHADRLPQRGSYSDTWNASYLTRDQVDKLAIYRPNPQSVPLRSTWTITQLWLHVFDISNSEHSIIGQAALAKRQLWGRLWPAMRKGKWPQLIEVDDVRDSGLTALAMAINDYFVKDPETIKRAVGGRVTNRELRTKGRDVGVGSSEGGSGEY